MASTSTEKPGGLQFPDTQNIVSFFLSTLDRIASPQIRQQIYNTVFRFCYQRPVLSSFLAIQVIFAVLPLICFIGFTTCAVLFFTAIALGVSVFWVGIAAVILFWTLVITFTLAATAWLYLAFCLASIRWLGRVTGYIETPPDQRSKQPTKPSTATTTPQNGTAPRPQQTLPTEDKPGKTTKLGNSKKDIRENYTQNDNLKTPLFPPTTNGIENGMHDTAILTG
ncbi:hypothetical protein ABW20_dc0101247 [Dactylellina cionopaga]|nr:hypothetical protein ABW20_dc0101247 [Dactylellina cionopaga]